MKDPCDSLRRGGAGKLEEKDAVKVASMRSGWKNGDEESSYFNIRRFSAGFRSRSDLTFGLRRSRRTSAGCTAVCPSFRSRYAGDLSRKAAKPDGTKANG